MTNTANYVTLGRSGLRVHPICLGAMTFGHEWGFGTDVASSDAMIARYLELGGNFIDTANIYTKGHSEKILGDYFRTGAGAGHRDRVVIATKFGGNLWPMDPNGGGSGTKAMMDAGITRCGACRPTPSTCCGATSGIATPPSRN